MIFVTGDVHGDWMRRLNTRAFYEQKTLNLTKDDYVLILGDFGIWDNSKEEIHNLNWLEDKPFTTLFIDGNHENYDILDALPVSEWHGGKVHFVRPSVIHLMRGQVFDICGKSFFAFGGASSHDIRDGVLEPGDPRISQWRFDYDRLFRVNHVSWWERELPDADEMDEGLKNLERIGNKVDFIVTHCGASSTAAAMSFGSYEPDRLTVYLEDIKQTVDFRRWYMGHYHVDHQVSEKECILFEQILRIV